MGNGLVPVGHAGFSERSEKVSFFKRSFAENVAMNYGNFDPVTTAVNGWIQSPGHRANMLAAHSVCGVAVLCHFGRFFFTQLFALT